MTCTKWTVGALASLGALVTLAGGCANPFPGEPSGYEYRAVIRWTGHGIPHILADDIASGTFGQGYAFAKLNACLLADQIVKVRSERSLHFGPGEQGDNLDSDFVMLHLGIYERGVQAFENASDEHRSIITGYVDGYNKYITDHAEDLECGDKPWLQPITPQDLMAHYAELATLASSRQLADYIAKAQPPTASLKLPPTKGSIADLRDKRVGSNGWGIGAERSANGRGMLLANPHFPWSGELKFFENHLRVPDVVDAYGASIMTAPGIQIGFTEAMAWTHTVSDGNRFNIYALTLDPADPTRYMYDGESRAIEPTTYTIDVLGDDGTIKEESRTLWQTHYGPMLVIDPLFRWGFETALTYRDANIDNDKMLQTWLAMDQAGSLAQFQAAHADIRGIPWVNTISASAEGEAWYIDSCPTPNLSDAALAQWEADANGGDLLVSLFADQDLVALDGSDSLYEWVDEPGARSPGLIPAADLPQLTRNDFVFNANDSYWLTNPAEPLVGYSPLHGLTGTPRTPRTRMNATTLMEMGEGTASGDDGRFDFNELRLAALSDRGMMAELLRDQVVGRCQGVTTVDYGGESVDITQACLALEGWDRRLDLDSVGAIVWREFLGDFTTAETKNAGALFREPFDPENPIETPRDLAQPGDDGSDRILEALAAAVVNLRDAGLTPDMSLGQAQFTKIWTDRSRTDVTTVPIHGGISHEGVTNLISYSVFQTTLDPVPPRGNVINQTTGLTDEGYYVNYGTSFIMAMQFTDEGPEASAFVTYGQSDDPDSDFYKDQTADFSAKRWRTVLFTEDDIAADPDLEVEVVFGYERSDGATAE